MKKATWNLLMILCFSICCFSCGHPLPLLSNHVHIFIYVLDECQITLLRSSSGSNPFLPTLPPHMYIHTPTSHTYTHRASTLFLYFLIVLCTDFCCRTSHITICSLVWEKSLWKWRFHHLCVSSAWHTVDI